MIQKYTPELALSKLQAFCSYQERCSQEIRQKLRTWGFDRNTADAILAGLIEDNFLDESRFVAAFVGGKFRTKRWGRIKIQQALAQKGISGQLCREAFESQIPEELYLETLRLVIERKASQLDEDMPKRERLQKMAAYAMGAGYEPGLVWAALGESDN